MNQSNLSGYGESILLVDVDSKIQIIPLMKLSTYYKSKGYFVEIIKLGYSGYPHNRKPTVINAEGFSKVFVSIIFPHNKEMVIIENCNEVTFGGTGYNIRSKLPDEIDILDHDYSLYPEHDRAIEFITRGCIRNCYFCFVPEKEGSLYEYKSIHKILDQNKGKEIRFLDNNFLAFEKSEEIMELLIQKNIRCCFNEGLDIRLITDRKANLLSRLNYYMPEYIFAFDDRKLLKIIERKTKILKRYITRKWQLKYYIYHNADNNLADLTFRINWCIKNEVLPYVQRDHNCYTDKNREFLIDLASWCNQAAFVKTHTFKEYMIKRIVKDDRKIKSIEIYEMFKEE